MVDYAPAKAKPARLHPLQDIIIISKSISKDNGQKIVQPCKMDIVAHGSSSVLTHVFQLTNYSHLGLKDVLCLPTEKKTGWSCVPAQFHECEKVAAQS